MNKFCAVFILLLLFIFLCAPVNAETGSVKVISKEGKDITKDNHEEGDSKDKPRPSDDSKNQNESKDDENGTDKKEESGLWENSIKAFQTAVTNGMEDFTYLIINQLMAGSVTIFETETETVEGENGTTELVTFSIKNKEINPFEHPIVKMCLEYTGAFYLIIAGLVILGSQIMLLIYRNSESIFVEFMTSITGEERPYDTNMQTAVCVCAGVIWIVFISAALLISWFRNLTVSAIAPHEVVLPAMYADSIPTQLLSSLSSYNNALQSTFGEYGIHLFVSLILVTGSIALVIIMIGAVRGFAYFLVIVFGIYTMLNFIDIINTGSVAFGIQMYLSSGNPDHITIGLIFGGIVNLIICILLVIYAATGLSNAISEA